MLFKMISISLLNYEGQQCPTLIGFFLKKNNDDSKYIHCFLPYIAIVDIELVANSFLFFLYNSITLLFLLKSKTDSTINPNRKKISKIT